MTDSVISLADRKSHVKKYERRKKLSTGVQRPTYTDILFHRRNVPRSQYYFTSGHKHLGNARNVNEEKSPFSVPPCSSIPSYIQIWKAERREKMKNFTGGKSSDVLQRLRIDVEIEAYEAKRHKEPNEAIAMTDVDPAYFTELGGRVVKEKFSVQQYVDDIRQVFRTRLLIGQERDDCIQIEQQFAEEQKRMNQIKNRYQQYVKEYEDFLKNDHESTMKLIREADDERVLSENLTIKRNHLSREYGQVRLDIYFWEENWRTVKMCQKFLYQIAPTSWRLQHDWINRVASDDDVKLTNNEDLFAHYKLEAAASLEDLISTFEKDVANAGPTELYFSDVTDLMRVFWAIEAQNLNALLHLETLAAPLAEITVTMKSTEEGIQSEIQEILEAITVLERSIDKTRERSMKLEEYADQLSKGAFKNVEFSREAQKLRVFIEDAYEDCVAPNDAKLDSFAMMRGIEKVYEELNMILDGLPKEFVVSAEREVKKQQNKERRDAEEAAKELLRMKRIMDAQRRAMEPKFKGKKLVWRSPPAKRKTVSEAADEDPTEDEKFFLEFFTTYCKEDDFREFRNKFPEDFEYIFKEKKLDFDEDEDEDEYEEKEKKEDESNEGTLVES